MVTHAALRYKTDSTALLQEASLYLGQTAREASHGRHLCDNAVRKAEPQNHAAVDRNQHAVIGRPNRDALRHRAAGDAIAVPLRLGALADERPGGVVGGGRSGRAVSGVE